ncbi:HAD family hydrolase [Actinacidiphila glaucinigra]|uniref:HAD family hydrolase n=1 Tax=Actinacidiphila glaucinigra TaxID=235986 RepID=UPI0036738698
MRAALDADGAIADATGKGDVSASKPAPDLVAQALERAGVHADQAVFVGDTTCRPPSTAASFGDDLARPSPSARPRSP